MSMRKLEERVVSPVQFGLVSLARKADCTICLIWGASAGVARWYLRVGGVILGG